MSPSGTLPTGLRFRSGRHLASLISTRPVESVAARAMPGVFICIEIRSPEDRLPSLRERAADYLKFGVPYVWILDPRARKAWRCTLEEMIEVTELRTANPDIAIPIEELFADN